MARVKNTEKVCGNCEHYGDKFCILWLCHTEPKEKGCVGFDEKGKRGIK